MTKSTTILIHGANASSQSWNYIKTFIKGECVAVDYSSNDGFDANLIELKQLADNIIGPIVILGHSLGGIYAMHLAGYLGDRCLAAVSMSTPFGGSGLADWAKLMYPWHKLFKDVGYRSKPIVESKKIAATITTPWLQIVTTKGNVPWIPADNDGVVTLKSQQCIGTLPQVTLFSNHYEVLIHPTTVELVRAFCEQHNLDIL